MGVRAAPEAPTTNGAPGALLIILFWIGNRVEGKGYVATCKPDSIMRESTSCYLFTFLMILIDWVSCQFTYHSICLLDVSAVHSYPNFIFSSVLEPFSCSS